ncbi:MAG: glycosyltransferase, partial [Dinghuibacter sp.]|nr:glycosyltransferase [Dinghuibacter sp.]
MVFDCERMKYPNTGLYHYCYHLASQLLYGAEPGVESLALYAPAHVQALFPATTQLIRQHPVHKLFMPRLNQGTVWHATHQHTQYLPPQHRNIKVALTVHDLNFLYDPHKNEFKKQRCLHRLQKLVHRADALICVSEYSRNDLQAHCRLYQKPVHVIYNGTSLLQP